MVLIVMLRKICIGIATAAVVLACGGASLAEDGCAFWLRYQPVAEQDLLKRYRAAAQEIVATENSAVMQSAVTELNRGIKGMLGAPLPLKVKSSRSGALLLGTARSPIIRNAIGASDCAALGPEAFIIRAVNLGQRSATAIAGGSDRAVLYGVFHFLRLLQTRQSIDRLNVTEQPAAPLRMANQWDNPRGDVERGYAGLSIFHWDRLPKIEPRYQDYARMLASLGMNAAVVNNVNTGSSGARNDQGGWKLITPEHLPKLAALAGMLRSYGIKTFVSVNFASPMMIGKLPTADPLDPAVQKWWAEEANEIYQQIPDFGGFLVKADSEGAPGPFSYGRDHAEGANTLARALDPHGGIVIWRCFVYGKQKNLDRATHAYDIFAPLDGRFARNVIVQIKNGPLDFQVREPALPLFGSMPRTNQMIELQITQEYTGQATHLVFLVPQWKEVLDFDTHARGPGSTVARVVTGKSFNRSHAGFAGVMNIGSEQNWTGHLFAQANTYGFGRLAWNPSLSSKQIADEWVKMTFGADPVVGRTVTAMMLRSWSIYENYTAPLGSNYMNDRDHYNPNPASRQNYHGATATGVGYDRTVATGSGYTSEYQRPVMEMYESVQTCPEELLLWFHHVPYDYRLRSGKTVIQHIYDTHFDGVEQVKGLIEQWQTLKGRIDDERWLHVLDRLHQQLAHATVWRDSINGYFFGLSGVPDARGRSIEVRDPAAKREGRSRIATRDLREDQELLHVELN